MTNNKKSINSIQINSDSIQSSNLAVGNYSSISICTDPPTAETRNRKRPQLNQTRVSSKKPTRASLRKLVNIIFKLDGDLNSFCIDYFSSISSYFSGGMNRNEKLNILLEKEDPRIILDALEKFDSEVLARHENLIIYEND